MDKLASLWSFVRKHKYLITLALFAVIIGFLDENSVVRRLGYAREESRLRDEIEKYRKEYEENTERLNELAVVYWRLSINWACLPIHINIAIRCVRKKNFIRLSTVQLHARLRQRRLFY